MRKIVKLIYLVVVLFLANSLEAQNLGFEATPVATPPANWSAVTGTWSVSTDPNFVRTGNQSMTITDPATSGTTLGTTNPVLTTTSAGYLIAIGWGKSNTASNALFYTGYRTGTTNTLNPTTTTSGQPANINNTSWSRVVSVSASSTIAAGNYGISLRAFRSASTAGTTLYFDDFILYSSSSAVPDLTAPNPASNVLVSGNTITWNNGIDNGAPASGIGGVVVLRGNGINLTPPTLNDQAMYNPTHGAAGVGSFSDGTNTWTVVGNINDASTTSFTDVSGTGGPYTYVVYMRDMAYNYSTGIASSIATPCVDPPTPGISVVNPSTATCATLGRVLTLTGASFGIGQTYVWQTSSTLGGSYTNISTSSSGSSLLINPTTTAFYRCAITCGATTVFSTPVEVEVISAISGSFTINNALPTGGGNFQTFTEAINYLSCGIAGPVTFNVEVGSGPYNEQFTIPQILGTSATNRITIKGNGAVIQFDPTTANRHVIKLDGADYITLDSLDIRTTGNTTSSFGWGIHLTNGADYDSIKNCNITIGSLSTTQSNSAGIVASGSTTVVTTAGSASYNVFVGNTITGGHQGIIISGTATSLNAVKNQIIRNTFKDFYANGVILTNNDSSVIAQNDFSRANLVAVGTFSGVQLGAGNIRCIIDGNKIHDTHNAATTQTGAAYGVFSTANDATVGNENRIINNLIYNFNSGSGIIYGLYNTGSDGVRYYHNTVVLDHSASTGGVTRGFFQTTAATNIDFKNNIIFINRGGTGEKYCVYFGTTTSTITSNNNVLHNISSAGTNGIGSFGTAGSSDLTAWKSANSGAYDQQSISVDPLFTDVNLLDYTPTETTVENIGASVGVSKDINGLSRILAAPDPGAFEVPASVGTDLRVEQLASPAIFTKGCYNTENIVVTIRNNAATTLNFATTNATVTVTVAGVVNTVYTATINTGTLASGAALNVSVFAPSSTIDMSGLGNYNFTVTVDVTGDVNPSNNTINVDRAKLSLTGGTITATPETYCAVGGTPKLTSTDAEGYNSVKWQQSINGGVSYTDITNSDTLIYTLTTPIGQNTYFRMVAVCGSNEQNSTEDSVIINNPQILTSQGATRCGPGSLTLNATAAPGATIKWYATTTSTTELGNGGTFVTPTILNTTTYYVAAGEGGSNLSTGIANAISTTGNTGFSDIGLMFDASVPFTIQSVAIYPIGTGGAGTVTIELRNSANTVLQSFVANVTTAAAPGVKTVVPINFNVPVGIGHRLVVNGVTGVTSLIRESTLANFTYPYTVPGVMSITSAFTGGASSSFYYYFYDWQITAGCEGTRTPVVATITAPPTITASTLDTLHVMVQMLL